ncbi:redoxin domain-containing protein [Arenimonas sp. MALMAid1274]|uniref:redoxin domain-containing protein n=1 Tax=Arenimonas sp. MALMAid1274 TaxID=3411630 RepID=UPI003BA35A5E
MPQASAAPELLPSLQWLNAEPQTVAGQRGRILALVFWNAASPYCHNLLDDLARLQSRYPLALSLLGIHQPKFDSELDPRLVLKTANRLGVAFPVANDRSWTTWQHYGIQSWPSVALIDTRGRLRQVFAGDHQLAALDAAVSGLVDEVGGAIVAAEPHRRTGAEPRLPLSFPSGLAVSDTHLYVADTGHHRILECTHSGRVLREFGTGHGDLVDGPADNAAFRRPRGLCLVREALYVADSGNHALRRIRLLDGAVETVLGNGRPGVVREGSHEAGAALPLNLPWDVTGTLDRLFIAMAGSNQVWEYDLGQARLKLLAGSGELGIADGPARGAMFGHPAGLALVQQTLYVADSGTSAIRAIQVAQSQVQTLVGQGLYDFGEQDGQRRDARLQYPLALALDPGSPVLWVADAYNGSLRKLRLGGGEMTTHELPQPLDQPAALAAGAGSLWIANTGAHDVLRYDLGNGKLTRLPIGE